MRLADEEPASFARVHVIGGTGGRDRAAIEVELRGGERLTIREGHVDGPGACGHRGAANVVLTISPRSGSTWRRVRRSIDGLAAVVRERFDLDPLSGHRFLFRNRRGDRVMYRGKTLSQSNKAASSFPRW